MDIKVQTNDKYEFLVTLDAEAIELLHQICSVCNEPSTDLVRRYILGGIALQATINQEIEKEITKGKSCRYVSLQTILKLFRK